MCFRRHSNPCPNTTEPSTRLSLERAREYDRVSELFAAKKAGGDPERGTPGHSPFGIEARRAQFDKSAYRQPVLTQKPMLPRKYRRGQDDALTDECRAQLEEMSDYNLMGEIEPKIGVAANASKR